MSTTTSESIAVPLAEATKMVALCERTLRQRIKEGVIPTMPRKPGQAIRISVDVLRRFAAGENVKAG